MVVTKLRGGTTIGNDTPVVTKTHVGGRFGNDTIGFVRVRKRKLNPNPWLGEDIRSSASFDIVKAMRNADGKPPNRRHHFGGTP